MSDRNFPKACQLVMGNTVFNNTPYGCERTFLFVLEPNKFVTDFGMYGHEYVVEP